MDANESSEAPEEVSPEEDIYPHWFTYIDTGDNEARHLYRDIISHGEKIQQLKQSRPTCYKQQVKKNGTSYCFNVTDT